MNQDNFDTEHDDDIEYVSRTQMKKHVEGLQELGKHLTELRPDQQAQVPMGDRLREAVADMARITANGAKRRQLQYIGKLMRHEDEDAIRDAVERFDSTTAAHNQHFHRLERLREGLVEQDSTAMDEVISAYPDCDIQHIRTLVRNARKERELNKPPASYRKLFQYLRELDEQQI